MIPRLPYRMHKKTFVGLAVLGAFVLAAQFVGLRQQILSKDLLPSAVEFSDFPGSASPLLTEFDPNALDENQWEKLGFSAKQARTIINYKNKVCRGNFVSKEQLARCFAISEAKFAELSPYILLPETADENFSKTARFASFEAKKLNIPGKFNPDNLSATDWERMGFSPKQAAAILKYKNFLGGSFRSKEKFSECFIISDAHYAQLAPFLLLPQSVPDDDYRKYPERTTATRITHTYFDPNDLDAAGWQRLGFSEKQAAVILNYKNRQLKGNFKTAEDLQKCFVVSAQKFEELKPYIRIAGSKNDAPLREQTAISVNRNDVEERTDFSKVDLNQISFAQLREFGFSEKQAAGFVSFRKKLGGFSSKDQLYHVYFADADLIRKLSSAAYLKPVPLQQIDIMTADEQTLKANPYFRYYADKIIYFRMSISDPDKLLKKVGAKPDDIAKMKIYMK